MLTASTFSKEAEENVTRIERKVVLIKGWRLADLMIDHDIGIATVRANTVKKLELDYFLLSQTICKAPSTTALRGWFKLLPRRSSQ